MGLLDRVLNPRITEKIIPPIKQHMEEVDPSYLASVTDIDGFLEEFELWEGYVSQQETTPELINSTAESFQSALANLKSDEAAYINALRSIKAFYFRHPNYRTPWVGTIAFENTDVAGMPSVDPFHYHSSPDNQKLLSAKLRVLDDRLKYRLAPPHGHTVSITRDRPTGVTLQVAGEGYASRTEPVVIGNRTEYASGEEEKYNQGVQAILEMIDQRLHDLQTIGDTVQSGIGIPLAVGLTVRLLDFLDTDAIRISRIDMADVSILQLCGLLMPSIPITHDSKLTAYRDLAIRLLSACVYRLNLFDNDPRRVAALGGMITKLSHSQFVLAHLLNNEVNRKTEANTMSLCEYMVEVKDVTGIKLLLIAIRDSNVSITQFIRYIIANSFKDLESNGDAVNLELIRTALQYADLHTIENLSIAMRTDLIILKANPDVQALLRETKTKMVGRKSEIDQVFEPLLAA